MVFIQDYQHSILNTRFIFKNYSGLYDINVFVIKNFKNSIFYKLHLYWFLLINDFTVFSYFELNLIMMYLIASILI